MPFYDFECLDCHQKYTVLVNWREKNGVKCPKCGSTEKKEHYEDYRVSSKGSPGANSGSGCTPSFGGG